MNKFAAGESLDGSSEGTITSAGMCASIDPEAARFPHCVVWTPLPVISWLAPYVGHIGICRENGVILDFAGPYFVNVDNFAFGATARYVQLSEQQCSLSSNLDIETHTVSSNDSQTSRVLSWDDGINRTMQHFQHIAYNIFTCNCHSFVASCLNKLEFRGSTNWNIIKVIFLIFSEGRWMSKRAIAKSFAPFVVVMCLGLYMVGWAFFMGWAIFNLLLMGWFVVGTYLLHGLIKC